MDQDAANATAPPPARRSKKALILMALVGLLSAAAGFAVPQLMGSAGHKPAGEESHEAKAVPQEHAHVGLGCVPFGEVVANLDDNRMMRYVRAKFSQLAIFVGLGHEPVDALGFTSEPSG